jgi:ascorbate-specific PTS system EIIC-type component UlaA
MAWGFLVPFVWGFSAKWMPVFLGLKPIRQRLLLATVLTNIIGVVFALFGSFLPATLLFVVASSLAVVALRLFEPSIKPPKTRGIHSSFPFFVRMAYAWLLIAATLGVAAVRWDTSGGIWGASRHALTVGFISVMILTVGQRILPAFAGMRLLWSTKLMFAGLCFVTLGCTLRVSSEVIAYQGYADWAWSVLPVSALCELTGLTFYATNILATFAFVPSHACNQPMVVGLPLGTGTI